MRAQLSSEAVQHTPGSSTSHSRLRRMLACVAIGFSVIAVAPAAAAAAPMGGMHSASGGMDMVDGSMGMDSCLREIMHQCKKD